jgi:chaperone required for assembly of F1-ATPase
MVTNTTKKMAQEAGQALQVAVYKEILKKSKLDQYAIIQKDGKPCRVPAKELIKEMQIPKI